eukprot:6890300-Pyramimonas_sp.AAC.1
MDSTTLWTAGASTPRVKRAARVQARTRQKTEQDSPRWGATGPAGESHHHPTRRPSTWPTQSGHT